MSTWLRRANAILGMNARNLKFIRPFNSGRAIKIANNKLATKKKLLAANLPTAKLYGSIKTRRDLYQFDWASLPASFVVKPNFGLGGSGIIIIYGKDKQGRWISTGGDTYTIEQLRDHVGNILDGTYSMSNIPDVAYFEERLRLSEEFKGVAYQGVPDVRVVVFNSVPVMAMLRLPTKASAGKANLHIGGIGVGVELITGETTYAVSKELGEITTHPDFNTQLGGLRIPQWENILKISIEVSRAIGLGYAGVDIVLDKEYGPMVLEVNGHPGLEIQNANHLTLRDRLDRVAGLNITSASKGLSVCKELFGPHHNTDEGNILGIFENAVVYGKTGSKLPVRVLIDTGLASTTITKQLAEKLGYTSALTELSKLQLPSTVASDRAQLVEDDFRQQIMSLHSDWVDVAAVRSSGQYILRPKLKISFELGGKTVQGQVAVSLDNRLPYPMIIGRRDLVGFLVNPSRGMM